ncbi:hypothetical protein BpHYR1_049946, partial [Brachionus plicatilis]
DEDVGPLAQKTEGVGAEQLGRPFDHKLHERYRLEVGLHVARLLDLVEQAGRHTHRDVVHVHFVHRRVARYQLK